MLSDSVRRQQRNVGIADAGGTPTNWRNPPTITHIAIQEQLNRKAGFFFLTNSVAVFL